MAIIDLHTQLPPEFVEALQTQAFDALNTWLKANAPAPVADLFCCFEGLSDYMRQIETGAPDEMLKRYGILSLAIDTIQDISALGGEFRGAHGQVYQASDWAKAGE